jgi:hypothetical protein
MKNSDNTFGDRLATVRIVKTRKTFGRSHSLFWGHYLRLLASGHKDWLQDRFVQRAVARDQVISASILSTYDDRRFCNEQRKRQ